MFTVYTQTYTKLMIHTLELSEFLVYIFSYTISAMMSKHKTTLCD